MVPWCQWGHASLVQAGDLLCFSLIRGKDSGLTFYCLGLNFLVAHRPCETLFLYDSTMDLHDLKSLAIELVRLCDPQQYMEYTIYTKSVKIKFMYKFKSWK